jgi:hypothetical protein
MPSLCFANGCPLFALKNDLASGKNIPKWSPRSCLGLNLGPNPNHTQNINLVLNLNSGLVSPQFYCHFDDFFQTKRHSKCDIMMSANWKQLAGFVKYNSNPTMHDKLSRSEQLPILLGPTCILMMTTPSTLCKNSLPNNNST